jgi:phage portal protein BeeE
MIIATAIGGCGRVLYRRVSENDRERATMHPAYKVVHDQPNRNAGPQRFWETITAHAVSTGNGYAEIEWDAGNRPRALWPITPDLICPKVEDGVLFYEYKQRKIKA